ncbi:AraC family transcriptional regulator [Mesobaculum littorinae]|uniref:AraC family transcriptional regulator n=1 Tax=Mesobaculum littorinae TaxID=2486419 RepID=A0A438ADY1_9RHOB|nr:AraC family transcriptional regulator [Mesobaculum littorinae]RVV96913.1 AraC family transcriptional regulator [Mesobaculum littorinae]
MILSQSSTFRPDPLSDVLEVLGARVTRQTRLEASGDWALSFPALDRLKFVALLQGKCWMQAAGRAPHLMQAGDICLIGTTDYAVSSDSTLVPQDGRHLFEDPRRDFVRLGGDEVVSIGGTVTFSGPSGDFLLDMLPDFLLVQRHTAGADVISIVLSFMSQEIEREAIGSTIVGARLADLLLVETFRAHAEQAGSAQCGWFGALSDPRIGRALQALHADVARAWTVAQLAAVAGMSRAAFSAEFCRRIGQPPLSYLRSWRLTLARRRLLQGETTVADVAHAVGYQSQSAFSQAFLRTFGRSPSADTRAKDGTSAP